MATININSGTRNEVVIQKNNPDQSVSLGSSAYGGVLPDIDLTVVTNGQTRFNLGASEPRRTLYLNGVRQRIGLDYTINLPYLDWIAPVPVATDDLLVLTF